jgi:xylose isomerase
VPGLGAVYLNHPEHTAHASPAAFAAALTSAGLAPAGVNLRWPAAEFRAGAFANPDAARREAALALALDACAFAAELRNAYDGAQRRQHKEQHEPQQQQLELVVWAQTDGYDYPLQVDYDAAWRRLVGGLRRLVDGCGTPHGVAVSLEWKPTDAAARFSFVPSTAAALRLAEQVGPGLGLTLDVGHMLLGGNTHSV